MLYEQKQARAWCSKKMKNENKILTEYIWEHILTYPFLEGHKQTQFHQHRWLIYETDMIS